MSEMQHVAHFFKSVLYLACYALCTLFILKIKMKYFEPEAMLGWMAMIFIFILFSLFFTYNKYLMLTQRAQIVLKG